MKLIMKFKFLKIFILSGIFFTGIVFAQSSSTYSRNGIGDMMYSYSARSMGISQAGVALSDRDFVNNINPAGWNKLRLTRMEFGFNYTGLSVIDNNASSFYSRGNFSGFTVAFPVSTTHGVGVVAGFVPYSESNYKVEKKGDPTLTGLDYSILYEGSGGLSKAFLGSSVRLFNDLNIGATFEYYFGNIKYISQVTFTDESVTTAYHEKEIKPRGLGTTLGIISPDFASFFGAGKIKELRIGASVNLVSKLKTDTLMLAYSANTYDTLNYGDVDMNVPTRLNLGLSFVYANNYQFFIDYTSQAWKEYSLNNIKGGNLRNSSRIVAGFEYKPPKELGSSAMAQIMWRGAVGYEQTQYTFNGTGINQFFVSGGFSYTLSPENTIDIGIQVGQRGTQDNGLIKEKFIKFNAGFSLGELWFFRAEK